MNTKIIQKLIVEAVVVGLSLVVIGSIVQKVLEKSNIAKNKQWLCLFLSGIVAHILFEITGINMWYIKHSVATQRLSIS